MSVSLVLFYAYAAVAVAGALGLVIARNLLHGVLSLFASLLAVSAIYMLLGTQFLAAMQLFIYGGAITVLVLFVVMLTRAAPERAGDFTQLSRPLSLALAVCFLILVSNVLVHTDWDYAAAHLHDTASLASILFSRYVLPFELVGIALTIALIGAIVLARADDGVGRIPPGDERPAGTAEEPAVRATLDGRERLPVAGAEGAVRP